MFIADKSTKYREMCKGLFPYFSFIQFLVVFSRVGVVLAQGAGEVVIAGEVAPGTEEEIIVFLVVQHAVDDLYGGDPYGTGRQASVQVSVVRMVYFRVFV